ncbi:ribonuclease III [candidate division KSB1 bacterium]|nr:ribonuclease III [candidate division KSB1 bacterium]
MQPNSKKSKIAQFFRKVFKTEKKKFISDSLIHELEQKFNYTFSDKKIIIQALKHRSYLSISGEERLSSNERLELLGDAVLGLVVTEHLFKDYPDKEEGELTAMKSLVVSRKVLAKIANSMQLGKYILMNEAEERAGGRKRPSIVADAMEAITGAIYIDGGLDEAVEFVNNYILCRLDTILNEEQNQNYKSILLEYSQSKCYGLPYYNVKHEDGPDHNKTFTIEVNINDKILGIGVGNSKKKAEQMAAKNALKKLTII